jgi:hypothetical protein
MKNKTIKITLSILTLILLIGYANALTQTTTGSQYFKFTKLMPDNVTMRYFTSFYFQEGLEDTIKSGNQFQSYILYNTYVDEWNSKYANLNISIYYCSLKVDFSGADSNQTITLTQENFTGTINNGQYFVNLKNKEAYYVYADCVFTSPQARTNANLQMPFDYTLIQPTYNCRACQYYEWIKQRTQIDKAVTLSDFTTTNVGYIKGIFRIFYELAIISFWVGLILLLIFTIGLLFWAIYWLYSYLTKHIRI